MKTKYVAWFLTMPSLSVIGIVVAFPLAYLIFVSLHSYNFAAGTGMNWAGLVNYIDLMRDARFIHSLEVTALYVSVSVTFQVIVGLGIALLLDRPFTGGTAVRTVFILPMVLAPVVTGLIFRTLLLSPIFGFVNYFLTLINLEPIAWLTDLKWALWSVCFIHIWQWTPFAFLVFFASLRGFPAEPFEAAVVDGANAVQMLRHITLPLLWPTIVVVIIMRLIVALRAFAALYAATGGGPGTVTETLNLYAFRTTFTYFRIGYGAAAASVLLLITMGLSIFFLRLRK